MVSDLFIETRLPRKLDDSVRYDDLLRNNSFG